MSLALPGAPVHPDADPVRRAKVIGNLVANACESTEPGGRIRLSAERVVADVTIRIEDRGCGMPPDLLPRLFDLFMQAEHTLDRARGGLGLGLPRVKRLSEMHGGSVAAHSAGDGQGSQFTVLLAALAEPWAPEQGIPASQPTPASPRRILVVDDDHDGAQMMALLLECDGHETLAVHDGAQALEHVARCSDRMRCCWTASRCAARCADKLGAPTCGSLR